MGQGLPTDPRGISANDNHTVLPAKLLCCPESSHRVEKVFLWLLQGTHLSQLLGVVLCCLLHGKLRVNGDHLAVRDGQLGEQVGLWHMDRQSHQQ